jgi:phosphoheptose isomerase
MTNATRDSRTETVANHLRESAAVKLRTIESCTTAILTPADLIAESFHNGGKLLLCGNGGSAADCQHMAAEFTSRLSADIVRPGLPAIALTTDTSFLTAYGNDFDFDGVFARQVQALGKSGDVLIGISTSGRSKNVIRALETAKAMGMKTVALTGAGTRTKEDGGSRMAETKMASGVAGTDSKRIGPRRWVQLLIAHTLRTARPPLAPLTKGGIGMCPLAKGGK